LNPKLNYPLQEIPSSGIILSRLNSVYAFHYMSLILILVWSNLWQGLKSSVMSYVWILNLHSCCTSGPPHTYRFNQRQYIRPKVPVTKFFIAYFPITYDVISFRSINTIFAAFFCSSVTVRDNLQTRTFIWADWICCWSELLLWADAAVEL
jgi:hypothetical protein